MIHIPRSPIDNKLISYIQNITWNCKTRLNVIE